MTRQAMLVVVDGRDSNGDDVHSEEVLEDGISVNNSTTVCDDISEEISRDERSNITTGSAATILKGVEAAFGAHRVE